MTLPCIASVTGTAVPVPGHDIDTDQIIPGRYLRCVTFDGLGGHLFEDLRVNAEGRALGHPLDDPRFQGATVLLTGRNFGCGSSREHAPQAMYRHGIRAVVAESFAEIFFGNATTLGMPCVCAKRPDIRSIAETVAAAPGTEVTVDIERLEIRFASRSVPCTIPAASREAFVSGTWDALETLLANAEAVQAVARRLPY